ncbi:3-deoxy-8-phosphooctulonate synthase [bacterium]|nr:3-deoxy-8-phosphooctulonate synthase [bacterium]
MIFSSDITIRIKDFMIGGNHPLVLIAGPCVIESEEMVMEVASTLKKITGRLDMPLIFKSSYDKANRLSITSPRGLGIVKGLDILAKVKKELDLPILTDVHLPQEVKEVARVADMLQIPAFLCRQTDLVLEAARTGLPLNIKKGQFLAPEDMKYIAQKAESVGNNQVVFTERGTTFGYHCLVVDMRNLVIMKQMGYPVVFDVTHSMQKPGGARGASGGTPEFIAPLARAGTAVGIDSLFIEVHPEPSNAWSDKSTQLKLNLVESFLEQIKRLDSLVKGLL